MFKFIFELSVPHLKPQVNGTHCNKYIMWRLYEYIGLIFYERAVEMFTRT